MQPQKYIRVAKRELPPVFFDRVIRLMRSVEHFMVVHTPADVTAEANHDCVYLIALERVWEEAMFVGDSIMSEQSEAAALRVQDKWLQRLEQESHGGFKAELAPDGELALLLLKAV